MSEAVEIIFRTITSFISLWIFVHLLGKQTIAQRTYHLYIASITLGTIAGNLAFNIKIKFLYFIIAIIIMGTVVFMLNLLAVRNPRFGKWIAGEPATVIQKGKILEESMERMGYSLDSLEQALRGKDIFNIDEVECAILEINGSLSVLKKNNTKMPPSRIYLYCPQQELYRLNWSMTGRSYMKTYPNTPTMTSG